VRLEEADDAFEVGFANDGFVHGRWLGPLHPRGSRHIEVGRESRSPWEVDDSYDVAHQSLTRNCDEAESAEHIGKAGEGAARNDEARVAHLKSAFPNVE